MPSKKRYLIHIESRTYCNVKEALKAIGHTGTVSSQRIGLNWLTRYWGQEEAQKRIFSLRDKPHYRTARRPFVLFKKALLVRKKKEPPQRRGRTLEEIYPSIEIPPLRVTIPPGTRPTAASAPEESPSYRTYVIGNPEFTAALNAREPAPSPGLIYYSQEAINTLQNITWDPTNVQTTTNETSLGSSTGRRR